VTEKASRKTWSVARLMSALVLAAWGALFWFLLATGRSSLYLSPRTAWVVPVGAVILTMATIGRLLTVRVEAAETLRTREAWGLGVLLAPVVVVFALPPAALGSYAASRRSSFATAGFGSSAEDISSGELSLVDIAGATRSRESMQALVRRAGTEASFVGFVTRDKGTPADEFVLTRFLISCCVADALSVQVRIVGAPPGKLKPDDWVRVTGDVYPLGREVVLRADEVTPVDRPKHPYVTP
jgi:putative membrane protein